MHGLCFLIFYELFVHFGSLTVRYILLNCLYPGLYLNFNVGFFIRKLILVFVL